jgi:ArsR family metal-binding transcriptional regulator
MEVSGYLQDLYPRKEPSFTLNRTVCGLQWSSGRCGEENCMALVLRLEPKIVQHEAYSLLKKGGRFGKVEVVVEW